MEGFKMVKLRYAAGKVISPEVHKIGVLALGSHLENHGAALPIDTDAKIATYLSFQASLITGAKFLGVLYAATEYDYVKHGVHLSTKELVEKQLIPTLHAAKDNLKIEAVVVVNAHGGNFPILSYLKDVEKELKLKIVFNNKIVEMEGPHAGTGELSMGAVLGITDLSKLEEHCEFGDYPEVGMVGLKEARKINKGIDEGASKLQEDGICIDRGLGEYLLETTIKDVVNNIQTLLSLKMSE
jgi:2-amino-5-formylamino-6-ribosylaminopyrimidin-4(3H)-one 5'-monophosphate deformylase